MKTLQTFLIESSQSQNLLANKLKAKFKESGGVIALEIPLDNNGTVVYGQISYDSDAITLVGVKGRNYHMMFKPDAYRTDNRQAVVDIVQAIKTEGGDPKDFYMLFSSQLKRNSKFKPW